MIPVCGRGGAVLLGVCKLRSAKVRKCEVVNCEVECEVFMRGACKLQGRKVRGVTMTARGGQRRDVIILHNLYGFGI